MVVFGEMSRGLKVLTIKRGSVFKMNLLPEDGIVPKNIEDKSRDKYFIILGVDGNRISVCSTLINSEINSKLFNIIGEYQHQIYAEEYDFLNGKDRYVDCYKLIELDYSKILNNGEYIGTVKDELVKEIVDIVRKAPLITEYKLKKYGLL